MERFADRYVNREEARRRFGGRADELGRAFDRGDPLADEVVAWMHARGPASRALFEQALTRGIASLAEPPPALARLFAQLDRVPPWLDFTRLERGARTYQRGGMATMFVLSAWSLMNGYHSAPAVKPLAFTRQLEAMAPRRLAETGRFVTEVSQSRGMQRHAPGFEIATRVRLVHAHVRAALTKSPAWRTSAWGLPINQADMLGTILEFSVLWIWGTEKLGFHFEPGERDDVMHLWRYVGWVSGVDDALLAWIADWASAVRTAELVYLVQPGPDDDSIALARALREVPVVNARTPFERVAGPIVQRVHDGLTWAFNGDAIAGALQIPNRRWRHVLTPVRGMVRVAERIRRTVPGGTWLASELGNARVRAHIAYLLERKEPTFEPPTHFDTTRGGRDRGSLTAS
ncbi:MAG: oxygenase MpaB family protein [Sandaracinaceae bacterium]